TGKYGNNTSAELLEDTLILGSRDGYVFAFTMNGKEKWRFRTGCIVIGTSIHNNRIYFGSEDGNFFCLDENGKEIWRFRFGEGGSYDYPSFFKGKVIVASMDCHLYVLNEETGEEIWRFATSIKQTARAPPPHEQFEVVLKKETHAEEYVPEEKYKKKEETVSLSNYHVESEYSSESEYRQKSDYDIEWVLFEGVLEGEDIWTSDLKDLSPQILKQN
ncbi:MAG: PQQ-like beta-propeller repeat protein, partial [Candidatus Aenigmatarchaeota archaeon]